MAKENVAVFSHETGRVFDELARDREKLLRNIHMGQDDAETLSQGTGRSCGDFTGNEMNPKCFPTGHRIKLKCLQMGQDMISTISQGTR